MLPGPQAAKTLKPEKAHDGVWKVKGSKVGDLLPDSTPQLPCAPTTPFPLSSATCSGPVSQRPDVPVGWLGIKGTAIEASDLKDNHHAAVNNHA